jgi:hypothetical protein
MSIIYNEGVEKRSGPGGERNTPEPGSQIGGSMSTTSVQREELLRRVLREATRRYNHELMDDGERQLLLDRIRHTRRQLKLVTTS